MLWEAWHELRVAGVGQLLEVGRLEALVGLGALGRVVHEEEVEEAQSGRAQPREDRLEVVVRLRLQGEVLLEVDPRMTSARGATEAGILLPMGGGLNNALKVLADVTCE